MEKLAIIELNEVGLKLSILKVSNGKFKLENENFDYFDLFSEVRADKLLKPKTISSLITTLKMYKRIIDMNGIEKTMTLAYPFLMKARNQKGFFDEVYNNTNMSFSYINDEEYIKDIYTSVSNLIDGTKGVIVSIGANDVALIKYNRRTTLGSQVLHFGVLSTLYNDNGERREYKDMIKYALDEMKSSDFEIPTDEELSFIGIGNPFINLGRIAKKIERYPLLLDNNYQVKKESFEKVEKFLSELEFEKVKKVKGLVDSADMLLVGMAVINAAFEYLKMNAVTISTANFRDGHVRNAIATENIDRYSDMLANSFDSYREFLPFDTDVNLRVNNMSNILFKQLKVMHKLPRAYVKALRIASYMYNCGKLISEVDYEKHGFYVILNSSLAGISQKDLLLGAFTCLCQSPDDFNISEWIKYQSIVTEEDLDAVRKMGLIIKLAAALNSSKEPVVTDVICDILGDSVILKTVSATDPIYEVTQGMKVADEYRKQFKKNLQLI